MTTPATSRTASWSILIALVAVTGLLYLDFCDLAYDCGCVALWRGAAADCNVHALDSRHCPWCEFGLVAGLIPFAGIVASQAWLVLASRARVLARTLLALAAFPVLGYGFAALYGLLTGYWTGGAG